MMHVPMGVTHVYQGFFYVECVWVTQTGGSHAYQDLSLVWSQAIAGGGGKRNYWYQSIHSGKTLMESGYISNLNTIELGNHITTTPYQGDTLRYAGALVLKFTKD
jgi:hypothetical protein